MACFVNTQHPYIVNNIDNNYFSDPNNLVHGPFPQMQGFVVYWAEEDEDKNTFTEQCFLAKMQAASLNYLRTPSVM